MRGQDGDINRDDWDEVGMGTKLMGRRQIDGNGVGMEKMSGMGWGWNKFLSPFHSLVRTLFPLLSPGQLRACLLF